MAAAKKDEHIQKVADYYNEKVPVFVRRPEGSKDNFFTVTLNGINYQIRYGVEVMVPRSVKLIIEESERNRERAEEAAQEKAQAFADGIASLGTR